MKNTVRRILSRAANNAKAGMKKHWQRRVSPIYNEYDVLLGEVLRAERSRRRMTQEELAVESGIARNYISRLERGTSSPTIATVAILAEALDLPFSQFIQLFVHSLELKENERVPSASLNQSK